MDMVCKITGAEGEEDLRRVTRMMKMVIPLILMTKDVLIRPVADRASRLNRLSRLRPRRRRGMTYPVRGWEI
jgi:hypothetical protein